MDISPVSNLRQTDASLIRESLRDVLRLYRQFCFAPCVPGPNFQKILESYLYTTTKLMFYLGRPEQSGLRLHIYISSQYVKRVLHNFRDSKHGDWDLAHLAHIEKRLERHFQEIFHDPVSLAVKEMEG